MKQKKWITLFFPLIMLLNVFSIFAEPSEGIGPSSGTCGENLTWELEDGVLTITGSGEMDNYSASSGAPWEARKNSITSIIVQDGVSSIGNYAFYGCVNLAVIQLPQSLRTIGLYSLKSTGIAEITIPEGVTTIGYSAISSCGNLHSIELPETLTRIEAYAFSNCDELREISIPNSINFLGTSVFSDCSNIPQLLYASPPETCAAP